MKVLKFLLTGLAVFYLFASIPKIANAQMASCIEFCAGDPECINACYGNSNIDPDPNFDPLQGPTSETFDTLNPLIISGSNQAESLSTPGGIISRVLVFAFPLAGLILFVMLVWGGGEILLGSTNKQLVEAGKKRLTAALVGFILLFTSYWIASILEIVLGVVILG